MNESMVTAADDRLLDDRYTSVPRNSPGAVSWPAIAAGATGAAALSLILLILGVGLGLSSVSPWTDRGVRPEAFGVSSILWLTLTQLAASGMGGYLAGRLRARWSGTAPDEVYFRDTAHGFLAWAIASLVTAALLTSALGSILSGGVKASGSVAAGVATLATTAVASSPSMNSDGDKNGSGGSSGYFVDTLFRTNTAPASASASASDAAGSVASPGATGGTDRLGDRSRSGAEATRILTSALTDGSLPADDASYLGQLVTQQTGLPQAEAEKRVNDTFARMQAKAKSLESAARAAADKASKTSAYASLWMFISLLVGAFVASLSATYGGRQRDLS